jgi:multiple sugar transport system ATP-binding protein
MSEYLLLRDLVKEYSPGKGIRDVSFSCDEGSFTVILGPSGAGKTTTLNLIAGLLQPDAGEIRMGDRDVSRVQPQDRRVSMAFEDYALYPTHSIYENIASPLRARKESEETVRGKVESIAALVGIDQHLHKLPSQVSGGQKQRTGLARCLVRDADFYLLDEPIAHLDAKLRHRMRGEFKRIHKELGKTMLYVTHDYREALALADVIIVMDEGMIVQIGSADEVFSWPRNTFVATLLGDPPMNLVPFETARVRGGELFLSSEIGSIAVADTSLPDMEQDGVVLGFRDFTVELGGPKEGIPGSVYVYEPIEDQKVYTISVGETRVKVRTPRNVTRDLNEQVSIKLNPRKIHLFDAKTGENIVGRGQ